MIYYGTRRRGHDLAFHLELRDALFASGLPFLVSINDVPEAWELYSRAGSITRLCSGKNGSKSELLIVHRGNPVATGLSEAILRPGLTGAILRRSAAPALGPRQARTRPATRPAPGPHQAHNQARAPGPNLSCFSKHFSGPKSGDIAVRPFLGQKAPFWIGSKSPSDVSEVRFLPGPRQRPVTSAVTSSAG